MENVTRLMKKAESTQCRVLIQYDPEEIGEEYAIKYYPEPCSDAHYYAYNTSLDSACHQLLDELREVAL